MTPEEKTDFIRRRRGRNWAVLLALLALVAMVYLIAMARLTQG
jgi:hypothetical protein